MASTAPEIDPRIRPDAYVYRTLPNGTSELYRVLGPARDVRGCVTGRYELENAKGQYSAYGKDRGCWIHKRIELTATEIVEGFELARASLSIDHLDREMSSHLKSVGLSPTGTTPNAGLAGGELPK